jgi:spore maturation protein A
MIVGSLVYAAINGSLDETVAAAFDGANESVKIILSVAGVLCFWTGFLRIAENSGISAGAARLLSPVVKRLFKNSSPKTREYITLNMTANLLGTGNAATPMGIRAMEEMDRENNNPLYPTKNMCMLVAINTASVQLLPTTILALRSAAGSADPTSVLPAIWAASFGGCAAAVIAVKLLIKDRS